MGAPPTWGEGNIPASAGLVLDLQRLQRGIPGGLGRIYLGYAAIGVLQLVLSFCVGLGYVWSIIDGVIILTGGTNRDGYGRVLPD